MPAPVTIESKQSPQDSGVTFYRLTGESFDAVQREIESLIDGGAENRAAQFTLPRQEHGKFIGRGVVVTLNAAVAG